MADQFDNAPVSPYAEEPPVETLDGSCDPASKSCKTCLATKVVRGVIAFLAIGTAAVYGAITVKPEMAEYLSFLPGTGGKAHACSSQGTSTCMASGCSASACPATGCASACPSASACASLSRASLMQGSCGQTASCSSAADGVVLATAAFDVSTETATEADAPAAETEAVPPAPPLPVR